MFLVRLLRCNYHLYLFYRNNKIVEEETCEMKQLKTVVDRISESITQGYVRGDDFTMYRKNN